MKRILCFCLALVFILCGCGESAPEESNPSETTTATTTPTETTQATTEPPITEFTLGEFTFTLLDGIEIIDTQETSYVLSLVPDKSWAMLSVVDASSSSSDALNAFLPVQHQRLSDPDTEHFNETTTEVSISGFDVTFDYYETTSDAGNTRYHLVGTFTDTWYIYTFYYVSLYDSTEYSKQFGSLIGSATHSGKEPREEIVLTSQLTTYPLNPDSTYTDLAQELPDHIYTTTGSENGLGGTIYRFTGTVTDYSTTDADGTVFECITVETADGTIFISNHYKAIYNATLLEFGADWTNAYYPYDVEDYTFPSVGETANFIGIYIGYSGAKEMPAVVLGANPALFEILEFDDPADQ